MSVSESAKEKRTRMTELEATAEEGEDGSGGHKGRIDGQKPEAEMH